MTNAVARRTRPMLTEIITSINPTSKEEGHGAALPASEAKGVRTPMRNIPRLDCAHGRVVLITVVPLGAGRFEARYGGQLIIASTREPLLDGARALIAAGHDPAAIAVMRHAGSDVDALTARIGMAARFYVEESAHGPVLRSVRKATPGAVDRPPIAQTRRINTQHYRGEGPGIDGPFDGRLP